MKWEITKSVLSEGGWSLVDVALWPVGVEVDEWGFARNGRCRSPIAKRIVRTSRLARDLRSVSEGVVADYYYTQQMDRDLADARLAAERMNP